MLQRAFESIVNGFLDAELQRLGLPPERLALVGFSQGTMMALHVGGWALMIAAFAFGSHSTTETYETALGVSSFTNVEATARGGVVATLGWAMRAIAWVWWLIDVFLVPGMVRRWNSTLAIGLGLGGLR